MASHPPGPGGGPRAFGTWLAGVSWRRWSRPVRLAAVGVLVLVLVLGVAGAGVGRGALRQPADPHRSGWSDADRYHRGLDGPHGPLPPGTAPPDARSVRVAAVAPRTPRWASSTACGSPVPARGW